MKRKIKFKPSVWQFLAIGYLAVIFLGSVLLVLPFATAQGQSTSYLNALFTATSATCVTGLTPYDTGTHWSLFGQIVILLLIQTGGLGFMTFVCVLFRIFKRGMGIYSRKAFITSAGEDSLNDMPRLIRRIFIGTGIFELTGACLLAIRFIPQFGAARGIYYSIWHAISAFCNAGMDVLGASLGEFTSLSSYATDPLVILTIGALIILGGLGFIVWSDVVDCRFNPKKFQLNTKVVLLVSGVLHVGSTVLYMIFERNNAALFGDYNFWERLLIAFFNGITSRTAGFSVIDSASLSDSGYLLTLFLMFIGGSSGSTAGGIKVGTFAVVVMGMIGVFRGRKDINIGKKRIEYSLLSQALAICAACMMMIMVSTIVICAVETNPDVTFMKVLFECVSALGTAGLSMNLTPTLGVASRIIIILLMYAGRVGILTLALALGQKRSSAEVRKPVDTLLIG